MFLEISYEVIKNHRNIGLLPLDCGVRKFPETETQWLVVITDQYGSFQCTGALITYHHMLFPASCLSKANNVNGKFKNKTHPSPFIPSPPSTIYAMYYLLFLFSTKYISVKMIVGRRTTVNQENPSMSKNIRCCFIHNLMNLPIEMT